MVFLDTNIIVRLYNGNLSLLSKKAKDFIEENEVYISPMVMLELEYLYEIKRVSEKSRIVIDYLSDKIGLQIDNCDFADIIEHTITEKWTRDPFGRIIVSHAKRRNARLVSTDRNIKKNYKKTII